MKIKGEYYLEDKELSDVILMDVIEIDKLIVDYEYYRNECLKLQKRNEYLLKNMQRLTSSVIKNAKKKISTNKKVT
tara:strand:+ start:5611 stop:5838 length:228 start_codon:yes stop_codon:yes gene_type:complete